MAEEAASLCALHVVVPWTGFPQASCKSSPRCVGSAGWSPHASMHRRPGAVWSIGLTFGKSISESEWGRERTNFLQVSSWARHGLSDNVRGPSRARSLLARKFALTTPEIAWSMGIGQQREQSEIEDCAVLVPTSRSSFVIGAGSQVDVSDYARICRCRRVPIIVHNGSLPGSVETNRRRSRRPSGLRREKPHTKT
jgi:hypothetical protein